MTEEELQDTFGLVIENYKKLTELLGYTSETISSDIWIYKEYILSDKIISNYYEQEK